MPVMLNCPLKGLYNATRLDPAKLASKRCSHHREVVRRQANRTQFPPVSASLTSSRPSGRVSNCRVALLMLPVLTMLIEVGATLTGAPPATYDTS